MIGRPLVNGCGGEEACERGGDGGVHIFHIPKRIERAWEQGKRWLRTVKPGGCDARRA